MGFRVHFIGFADARLSILYDVKSVAEDEDLEYEDPSVDMLKPRVSDSHSQSASCVEDEVYDDVAPTMNVTHSERNNHQNSVDDGAVYDDAESKANLKAVIHTPQNDDLLYEAYDDPSFPDSVMTNNIETSPVGKMFDKDSEISYEKFYYGKWDCKADSDNELAFKRGDIIEILSQDYDKFGWWIGYLKGMIGLVPREYVTPAYELIHG